MVARLPRLVVAAPASGHGKTTIATGLMAALRARGLEVSGHKVGPDYIDPGYHALATGRPGRNLDPFLVGEQRLVPLLLNGAAGADVAIIEGVMGLHDGQLGTDGFASTAHVAGVTKAPVVLVVDISHASRSVAAVVQGMAAFDPTVRVAGVILNKAGSDRHAKECADALERTGFPVLGVLRRDDGVEAPSRHLGLVPAAERTEAAAALERLARQVEHHVDLDAILEIARSAADLDAEAWNAADHVTPVVGAPVVAMAGGRAFTFRYAETEELLRAAGCEVVTFDPLAASDLPAGTVGLYLGGGFPEVHAAELSANAPLRARINEAVRDGLPTVAECAGLLYLCRTLDGAPMAGAVDADAAMTPRLTLGYRTGIAPADQLSGVAGTRVSGHEFHRTKVNPPAGTPAWLLDGKSDGFGTDTLSASYLHTHWAGHPNLAQRFVTALPTLAPQFAGKRTVLTTETGAELRNSGEGPGLAHHGDREVGPGLADFAVNVHEDGPPSFLLDAVRAAGVTSYPDPAKAEVALADLHGRTPDEVLATAGAAEAFTLIARARTWQRPVVVHPQFTEPDVALAAAGHTPEHVVPTGDFRLDPTLVPDDADLVMVGNPTNPTGVLHSADAIRALLRPDRVVVVDEAFMDAVEKESLAGEGHEGLLVVRSLTKLWAIPGIRAGYVLGAPALLAELRAHQPPWSVSAAASAAMVAVAGQAGRDERQRRARGIADDRARLVEALDDLGIATVSGAAPFVLARVPVGTHARLREQGVAVRRCDTFPGLDDGWIRIAVRSVGRTGALLEALGGTSDEPVPTRVGEVVLVGGGPGDPGLLTVAGRAAIESADVIVTDRLAPQAALAWARHDVEVIDAAKVPFGRAMPQEEINRLLVEHARAGRRVVRFKGGDGYVFGRGGEEVIACAEAGVPVRVIPGVSSSIAAPALAGIPVTHRGLVQGFTVVSGHVPPGHPDSSVDWAALATAGTTLVVLMGVRTLPAITASLVAAGLDPDTPAAVIADAALPSQHTVLGTVATIAEVAAGTAPPAVAVIGDVVTLAER